MKHVQHILLLLFCSISLISCSTDVVTPKITAAMDKNRKLDSPRFLTQTHYLSWINSSTDIYVMVRPGINPTCIPESDCLPTLKSYLQNSLVWQSWHARKGGQFRILGLLPVGTAYHFYKIDPPEHLDTGYYVFHAVIDSGEFKGAKIFYRYDETHEDDLKLLREVSFSLSS